MELNQSDSSEESKESLGSVVTENKTTEWFHNEFRDEELMILIYLLYTQDNRNYINDEIQPLIPFLSTLDESLTEGLRGLIKSKMDRFKEILESKGLLIYPIDFIDYGEINIRQVDKLVVGNVGNDDDRRGLCFALSYMKKYRMSIIRNEIIRLFEKDIDLTPSGNIQSISFISKRVDSYTYVKDMGIGLYRNIHSNRDHYETTVMYWSGIEEKKRESEWLVV